MLVRIDRQLDLEQQLLEIDISRFESRWKKSLRDALHSLLGQTESEWNQKLRAEITALDAALVQGNPTKIYEAFDECRRVIYRTLVAIFRDLNMVLRGLLEEWRPLNAVLEEFL